MSDQLDLFATPAVLPDGFRYEREVITPEMEQMLVQEIRGLPFKEFEFKGYVGKRRTVSFGWSYDFAMEQLCAAEPMPQFLHTVREAAAAFAWIPAESLQQALISEYGPNAGIGWHRDKAVFDRVVGISLVSACRFRLRRRTPEGWERVTLDVEPRSAYLLSGPVRTEWEHSIPEVESPRYSITFRSLRAASR